MQRDYIFFAGRPTAASGNTCFNADYYPYGQENDYDTSCSPTYKFTGYEYDSETGDYYAYARYYNPRLGRFMSPDPLGGAILNPQSLNRYAYVVNNPTNFVDPTGLVCEPDMPNANCESESQPFGGGSFLGYSESELFLLAFSPTGLETVPDSSYDCINTGDCGPGTVEPVYGNIGLLSPLGMTGVVFDGPGNLQPPAPPQAQAQQNACTQPILNAVSNQFGPGTYSVTNTFPQGGATDLQITATNLAASQFNALQTGRYPLNWWTYAIGYGPTLHVTGATLFDPNAYFQQ